MPELSAKEKAALRNAAQRLKPALHIGRKGITPAAVDEMLRAFKVTELVKVAFKADRDELPALAEELATKTESVCVGGVGRRRSFYRRRAV